MDENPANEGECSKCREMQQMKGNAAKEGI